MKKEEIDLELMYEKDTGKEWHRSYPSEYIAWLEKKVVELLVKNNVGLADVVSMSKCCNADCDEPIASPDGVYCEFHRSM